MTQPSITHQDGGRQPEVADVTSAKATAQRPAQPPARARVPKEAICPICATRFDPWASGGRCPVCNEQVVPQQDVTRAIPVVTPAWAWLKAGGWRLVLLMAFVVYQLALLIYLWVSFANAHLV